MSLEEQDAAEGRLRRECRESKRRLAALSSELADRISVLRRLSGHLEAVQREPEEADVPLRSVELASLLAKLPEASKLRELMAELKQEHERQRGLLQQLSHFE